MIEVWKQAKLTLQANPTHLHVAIKVEFETKETPGERERTCTALDRASMLNMPFQEFAQTLCTLIDGTAKRLSKNISDEANVTVHVTYSTFSSFREVTEHCDHYMRSKYSDPLVIMQVPQPDKKDLN